MRIRVLFAAGAVLGLLAGCQSSPWQTASSSRFGFNWFGRNGSGSASDRRSEFSDARHRSRTGPSRFHDDGKGVVQSGFESDSGGGPIREADATAVTANLKRGHVAEVEGRIDQAKLFYQRVLEIEPNNPLAHDRLAIIADKQGDFRLSEEHYLTALRANRDDPNLLSDLGYSFLLQNRHEESEYYLRQALRSDPSHLRALNNLGLLYSRRGDYDGALAMFRLTGPEPEVQAKMRELFPTGRPRRDASIERRPHSFLDSPNASGEFASTTQQPEAVANARSGSSTALPPWAGGASGIRTTDQPTAPGAVPVGARSPIAPSPRGNDDIYRKNPIDQSDPAYSARTAAGASFSTNGGSNWGGGDGVPFDGRSNPNTAQGYSAETGRGGAGFGTSGDTYPTMTPRSGGEGYFPQQPKSAVPLDAVPEWPPAPPARTENPWGRGRETSGIQVPNGTTMPAGARPLPRSGIQTASGVAPQTPSFGPAAGRDLREGSPEDPRRRAALLGLNAGADGIFPVMPGSGGSASQVGPGGQQSTPPAGWSVGPSTMVQPAGAYQPATPQLPRNTQGAVVPANAHRFASAGTANVEGPRETGVGSSGGFGSETYRTAARPLSQRDGAFAPGRSYRPQPTTGHAPNDAYRQQVQQYPPSQNPQPYSNRQPYSNPPSYSNPVSYPNPPSYDAGGYAPRPRNW